MAVNRPWSADKDETLRTLWGQHRVSIAEIANAVGFAASSVARRADVLGLPKRADCRSMTPEQLRKVEELHAKRISFRQIAREIGSDGQTVARYLKRVHGVDQPPPSRTRWSLEDMRIFHELWSPMMSPDANARRIAAKIGRHPEGVLSKAKMVGLCGHVEADPYRPKPEDAARHASICLAQGGFPWRELVNGRSVEFRPLVREAQAA